MAKSKIKAILVMLLACLMMLFVGSCATAKIDIDRDGSGTATITIAKSESITENTIRDEMREIFEGVDRHSGFDNRLMMESLTEAEEYYQVVISFERIHYTKGIGNYAYKDGTDVLTKDANIVNSLTQWGKGDYRLESYQAYDDSIYTLPKDESLAFNPILLETGEEILMSPTDDESAAGYPGFLDADGLLSQNKRGKLFTFLLADMEGLQSIEFSFQGDIIAYGGHGVEVVDESTVRITPITVSAQVTGTDENGDPFSITKDVNCFIGCVYFELAPNAVWIWILAVVIVLLLAFIVLGICKGWFKKWFSSKGVKQFFKNYDLYLMMIPTLLLLLLFMYLPMSGIIMAFKNYRSEDGMFGSEWAAYGGFKNFYDIFTNPTIEFGSLIANTFILALLRFIFGFVCAVFLALLFSYLQEGAFKKTVQTISYFPYFISWLTVSAIAYLFLNSYESGGLFNRIIVDWFGGESISWYDNPKYWRTILTFTYIWKTLGYSTIVYLAAITSINPALYEAARIDGAGRLGQLWNITIPGLLPVIGVQIIFSLGNLVKDDIDQIVSMTRSSPNLEETTKVLGVAIFNSIGNGGESSVTAMGLMQGIAALILVWASNAIVKKLGVDGAF